jgi:hypothetical protein
MASSDGGVGEKRNPQCLQEMPKSSTSYLQIMIVLVTICSLGFSRRRILRKGGELVLYMHDSIQVRGFPEQFRTTLYSSKLIKETIRDFVQSSLRAV